MFQTLRLQEIKQILINNTLTKPAELLAGKYETIGPTLTTVSGNILYNILNTTQSSTISPCYIEKVNCSTKLNTDSSSFISTTSSPPLASSQSPSTVTTFTTLFLLGTMLSSTLTPDKETNSSLFDINNETYSFINDSNNKLIKNSVLEQINDYDDYNSVSNKKLLNNSLKNLERDVNITRHYIIPLVVKALSYDKKDNGLNYDKNNETEEDFLTPEDYPDNETDIIFNINDNLNLTTLNDIDNYTESTTMYSDDGCQYITICPDTSSTVSGILQSHPTELSNFHSETTEFRTQPTSTFTPVATGNLNY